MKPYYQDDAVTLYHGDCREVLPRVTFSAIVSDAPYGVGMQYGDAFTDAPEAVSELAGFLTPYLLGSDRAALFTGVPQMWLWPQPKWVLCWSIHPATNEFSPWGFSQWQPILVYGKDPYLAACRGPQPTVYVDSKPPDKRGIDHPCPKPQQLLRWVVNRTTAPTDVIVDPFCGTGTTLRAAKDLGRKAIGIELDERWCDLAARRCAQEVLL